MGRQTETLRLMLFLYYPYNLIYSKNIGIPLYDVLVQNERSIDYSEYISRRTIIDTLVVDIMAPASRRNDDDDDSSNTTTTRVSWTGDTTPTTVDGAMASFDNASSSSSSSSNEHADTTVTTFDIHPSSSPSSGGNTNNNNRGYSSTTDATAPGTTENTARWTKYLPEAWGIRQSVESSKYRWCARESALWGIATGSAMALHRIRMHSPTSRVINVGFSSVFLVMGGSYYFCVKRRDYQEQMIELLMQLNTFEPVQNMPAERPIDETHPFVLPDTTGAASSNQEPIRTKQYVAHLPERKEWQAPIPTQDAANIFQPYSENDKKWIKQKKYKLYKKMFCYDHSFCFL